MPADPAKKLAFLAAAAAGVCMSMTALAGPALAYEPPAERVPESIFPGPPVYPTYPEPSTAPTEPTVTPWDGPDATSIGIGVLGGLAASAAGVGVTHVVRRRRDRLAF
ncbi:hypothetical protein ACWF0M_18490 [Kribbella sp. NPDC055110]